MLLQRTIILAALAALPTWATQLGGTYNSASAMMTANSNQTFTNIDFNAFTTGTTFDPNVTIGLVDFSGPGSNPLAIAGNPGGTWPAGNVLRRTSGNPGQPINIALDSSVRAFGASIGLVQFAPPAGLPTITVSYTSDSFYSYSLTVSDLSAPIYIGFATDSAITNLSISADFSFLYVALNNASYGVANATTETPEVGTMLLIGSGLLSVQMLHRRKRKMLAKAAGKVSPAPSNATPAIAVTLASVSA